MQKYGLDKFRTLLNLRNQKILDFLISEIKKSEIFGN